MPTYNVQADLRTGDIHVVAKDGRRYSLDELEAAEDRARRGDAAAQQILVQVDLSVDDAGRSIAEATSPCERACPECHATG